MAEKPDDWCCWVGRERKREEERGREKKRREGTRDHHAAKDMAKQPAADP